MLKMQMNFKNKIRYREKLHMMEIFDENVLVQLVINENSVIKSADQQLHAST